MRKLFALTILVVAGLASGALAQGKPEVAEIDAWLVRDPQMSAQFAVADQMGYFKEEGIKVNPRWYISGPDLPSMWGAGNVHLFWPELLAQLAGYLCTPDATTAGV